jgi:hypothetical protein
MGAAECCNNREKLSEVEKPGARSTRAKKNGKSKEPARQADTSVTPEEVQKLEKLLKVHSSIRWGKTQEEVQGVMADLGFSAEEALCWIDPKTGNQALHIAAQNGHNRLVDLVLCTKADVNAQNKHGQTPLHMTVEYDLYFTSKRLLDKNADPQRANTAGHPAILGISGNKTGADAWDNPVTILVGAEDDPAELEEAMLALEKTDPTTLDKVSLAKAGIQKKRLCKVGWDAARFRKLMATLP